MTFRIKTALAASAAVVAARPAFAQLAAGGLQQYDFVTMITNGTAKVQLIATAIVILIGIAMSVRAAADARSIALTAGGAIAAIVLIWGLPMVPQMVGIAQGALQTL